MIRKSTKPANWLIAFPDQRLSTPKIRRRVPSMSKKRQRESRIYVRLRKAFLAANPFCYRCAYMWGIAPATEVHHQFGRGVNYLNVATWKSSCRPCNVFAVEHPQKARQEGWICPVGKWMSKPL